MNIIPLYGSQPTEGETTTHHSAVSQEHTREPTSTERLTGTEQSVQTGQQCEWRAVERLVQDPSKLQKREEEKERETDFSHRVPHSVRILRLNDLKDTINITFKIL